MKLAHSYLLLMLSLELDFWISLANNTNITRVRDRPIPLLSVSMNADYRNYVQRLLLSIDYPINRIIIQIGNSNATIVDDIIRKINNVTTVRPDLNISITCIKFNPGSAYGFNFGLRGLLQIANESHFDNKNLNGNFSLHNHNYRHSYHSIHGLHHSSSYVLVVNNDIAFYPGILKSIAKQVEWNLHHNTLFGIGFTSLCCGSEWSAVIFTKRLIMKIGIFDENFYPAYYEDDDYAIRSFYSGYQAVKFNNTPLLHGELDGSKDYLSGIFNDLYLNANVKIDMNRQIWKRMFEAGVEFSKPYINKKWGIPNDEIKKEMLKNKNINIDCKTIEGINGNCFTYYSRPFNDTKNNLSYWVMDYVAHKRIFDIGN